MSQDRVVIAESVRRQDRLAHFMPTSPTCPSGVGHASTAMELARSAMRHGWTNGATWLAAIDIKSLIYCILVETCTATDFYLNLNHPDLRIIPY